MKKLSLSALALALAGFMAAGFGGAAHAADAKAPAKAHHHAHHAHHCRDCKKKDADKVATTAPAATADESHTDIPAPATGDAAPAPAAQ